MTILPGRHPAQPRHCRTLQVSRVAEPDGTPRRRFQWRHEPADGVHDLGDGQIVSEELASRSGRTWWRDPCWRGSIPSAAPRARMISLLIGIGREHEFSQEARKVPLGCRHQDPGLHLIERREIGIAQYFAAAQHQNVALDERCRSAHPPAPARAWCFAVYRSIIPAFHELIDGKCPPIPHVFVEILEQ